MKIKNIPMLIGIALPILFILIISAVLYLPSLSIKPQYNFIYIMDGDYQGAYSEYMSKYMYDIKDGKLITRENTKSYPEQILTENKVTLYVYDVKQNASREISFEDAQKLTLDPGPASPDGYTVSYQYSHDGIFEIFGSSRQPDGYFISKGRGVKKLTGIVSEDGYWGYGDNFQVIGWIK